MMLIALLALFLTASASRDLQKRSFSRLGCMGEYDAAIYARLDRVCEECYHVFRESDIHTDCRSNCFKNDFFPQCVGALMLKKEHSQLDDYADRLYGKRNAAMNLPYH